MAAERILIVEDEAIVRLHLGKMLERLGYVVDGAVSSGEAALEHAERQRPDLVLMDVRLEGEMDGIEAAGELRRRFGCSIVFLTAYADPPTLERARAVEPAGYLVKPFEDQDVRATVATALTKERAMSRAQAFSRDLGSILDQLDVGTALLDDQGQVIYLSRPAEDLLGVGQGALGRSWREVLPLDGESAARLEALSEVPGEERRRLAASLDGPVGRQLEIDVRDDPRGTGQRILFFYDRTEVHELRRLIGEKAQFHGIVGRSAPMQLVYEDVRQAAAVDWPVLIGGETGTGKELVARAIHASSPRHRRPFLAVNCAGLTESLLSSQLFGHKKGAFTGAVSDHPGFFEMADGGTLFLDEIGDISMAVQRSLLRVLEEKRVTPLGGTRSRPVDVRIVTATHQNLAKEVEEGRFRADLLYRIRVARVSLPPLRERGGDVPLLALWFLDRCRAATGKAVDRFEDEALGRLASYAWPGNVRELKSAIEYAVIRCRGEAIGPADLPPELQPVSAADGMPAPEPDLDERSRILAALEQAGGNRSRAARLLGISRATFYRRLDSLGGLPEAGAGQP
ncbi:MAG: sigma 54-interacting transcriptional regulator [Holophagales bacterium]|nr:sigma 54-interacting transcriptional regulator [Holophagales bacterium]